VSKPGITVTVTPSGRWSWYVTVSVARGDGWIGRVVVERTVFGSRARADRIARRWVQREADWQRRLATETHTVGDR
jgi:hypothetical protein